MKRNYFKNLNAELNEVVNVNELQLNIPEGFTKQLNSMELRKLANDQLLEAGMMLHNIVEADGSSRIVEANKNAKPIEKDCQISKRLEEYINKFNK